MKLFVDSANLDEIEEVLQRGLIRGITTNPSLLAREPKSEFKAHIARIIDLIQKYEKCCPEPMHLSVEVFSRNPQEIEEQAWNFAETFNYDYLSIKVQIGWDELIAIRHLTEEGYSVNCTCCMSAMQATVAAAAGARYVSIFYHRIDETPVNVSEEGSVSQFVMQQNMVSENALDSLDLDPMYVVRSTRELLTRSYSNTEIIVGSLHNVVEVKRAGLMGAHICTVPPKVLRAMAYHHKSEARIKQFFSDFQKWVAPE